MAVHTFSCVISFLTFLCNIRVELFVENVLCVTVLRLEYILVFTVWFTKANQFEFACFVSNVYFYTMRTHYYMKYSNNYSCKCI